MSEQQIRGPRRPRPRIAPLDDTALSEAYVIVEQAGPFFATLMRVPEPGQPIPDDFELCPVCLGEGCPDCFDLGQVGGFDAQVLEECVLEAGLASGAYDAIAGQMPLGVRSMAELWLGQIKGRILQGWCEEGRIVPSDIHRDMYELVVPPTDAYVAEWADVEGVRRAYTPFDIEAWIAAEVARGRVVEKCGLWHTSSEPGSEDELIAGQDAPRLEA